MTRGKKNQNEERKFLLLTKKRNKSSFFSSSSSSESNPYTHSIHKTKLKRIIKREMKNEISMNGGEGKEIISFFNIYIVVYTHTYIQQ